LEGMSVSFGLERQGSYQPPESVNMIPPLLSSGSTAAYTTAMTPSTSRGTPYYHPTPVFGFHVGSHVGSSYDSPSSHLSSPHLPSHYIYATPTPSSRRPLLMTTPSSFPTRRLPGPTAQPSGPIPQPQFVLPPPTAEDVFYAPSSFYPPQPVTPQRSRPSNKEHRCPTCDKLFARPSALQTHQAVHTGAKRESRSGRPT
jgi:hypothetical protein